MSDSRRQALIAVVLAFALVVVFQLDGGFLPGNDAKPNVYGAATLLAEGRLSFDPEREPFMFTWEVDGPRGPRVGSLVNWTSPIDGVSPRELQARGALRVKAPKYYVIESERGGFVSAYGPATALFALPVFAVLHATLGDLREHHAALWYGGKVAASLYIALAAAFTFLTARRLRASERHAIVIALVYALGTCAWSVLSQTLWQQAVDSFFLALAAFLLVRALTTEGEDREKRAFAWCGLAFGIATACRPTSFVVLATVAVCLVFARRRSAVAFAGGALLPVIGVLLYNGATFGSPLAFGQAVSIERTERAIWTLPFEGLAGLLVSPGRGLLVFSPVIAFAIWGLVRAFRVEKDDRIVALRILGCAAAAAVLVEASHFEWWGGWAYGYRRIADAMPLVVLGLVPVAEDIARKGVARIGFAVAFAWSIAVQAIGATTYDLDGWNARSIDGVRRDIDRPEYHDRLWSIDDSPILYYATHLGRARAHRREWIEIWLHQPTA